MLQGRKLRNFLVEKMRSSTDLMRAEASNCLELESSLADRVYGFLVRSTTTPNIEDEFSSSDLCKNSEVEDISEIVNIIYQRAHEDGNHFEIVTAVHDIQTSYSSARRLYENIFKNVISQNKYIVRQEKSFLFIGYIWSTGGQPQVSPKVLFSHVRALPRVLKTFLFLGIFALIVAWSLYLFFDSPFHLLGFFGAYLSTVGLFYILVIVISIFSLIYLRAAGYFQDVHRANNYSIPELTEFFHQIELSLVKIKANEVLDRTKLRRETLNEFNQLSAYKTDFIDRIFSELEAEIIDKDNAIFSLADDGFLTTFYRIKRLFAEESIRVAAGIAIDDSSLAAIVQKVILAKKNSYSAAIQYWQNNSIKLSFLTHGIGGHIATCVAYSVSDSDSSKVSDLLELGKIFKLGRLTLVAPDVPLLSLTLPKTSPFSASLQHFSEAYIFSNRNDVVLKLSSAIANYLSFPSASPSIGSRLGNIYISSESKGGIVNLEALNNDLSELAPYLSDVTLYRFLKSTQQLNKETDTKQSATKGFSSIAHTQQDSNHSHKEVYLTLLEKVTYFDCTDYVDFSVEADRSCTKRSPRKTGILSRARLSKKASYLDDIQVIFDQLLASRDSHRGYFRGVFSQLLMCRITFFGFQGFLDSLSEIDSIVSQDVRTRSKIPSKIIESSQKNDLKEKRKELLNLLHEICLSKQIRALISHQRYQLDVLGQKATFDIALPTDIDPRDIAIAIEKTNQKLKEDYPQAQLKVEDVSFKANGAPHGESYITVRAENINIEDLLEDKLEQLATDFEKRLEEMTVDVERKLRKEFEVSIKGISESDRYRAATNTQIIDTEEKIVKGLSKGGNVDLSGSIFITTDSFKGRIMTNPTNVNVGGDAIGNFQFGDNNVSTAKIQIDSLPKSDDVNIRTELGALKALIDSLSSEDQKKIENAFNDAEEELKKSKPNKDEVGQALDRALGYAQKASGFAEAVEKLRPHVKNTVGWLGSSWHKLLPLVGLVV